MTGILGHIKSLLSVKVTATPHPFRTSGEVTPSGRKTPKIIEPDNLVTIGGKPFTQDDTDEGFEADIWNPLTDLRSDKIGHADLNLIDEKGLDGTKYRELKVYWAGGKSAYVASRELKDRRGYGVRTLEKYWAAFALSTAPLSSGGGGAAKQPQRTAKAGMTIDFQ